MARQGPTKAKPPGDKAKLGLDTLRDLADGQAEATINAAPRRRPDGSPAGGSTPHHNPATPPTRHD